MLRLVPKGVTGYIVTWYIRLIIMYDCSLLKTGVKWVANRVDLRTGISRMARKQ